MDKFGIFKLLNSFLTFCQQNKGDFTQNSVQNKEKFNFSNLVSSLTKKGEKESKEELSPTPSKPPLTTQTAPLQQSMLSTMTSHEQFVKRVKERNKIN